MDQKLKHIIKNSIEIEKENSLYAHMFGSKDLVNKSVQIDINNKDFICFNSSEQLLKNQIQFKSTPTLVMPNKLTNKRNLFTNCYNYEENENKFANNMKETETQENIDENMSLFFNRNKDLIHKKKNGNFEQYLDNSLGLSPVKKGRKTSNNNMSFNIIDNSLLTHEMIKKKSIEELSHDLDCIQMNSFPFNGNSMKNPFELQSDFMDESFKSLSKCSDLDLKQEQNAAFDQTIRLPNSEFENKSIDSYFRQNSEPIKDFDLFKISDQIKRDSILKSSSNDISMNSEDEMSSINDSFISVTDEISCSDSTLLIAQKIIDKNNRKRKADRSHTFSPSFNSTMNLCKENSSGGALKTNQTFMTSGLGTVSTFGTRNQSMPHSESSSIGSPVGNAINLNQLLTISPTELSLTIGCFVSFKLNYLKVKNHSITSFKANFKLSANVETLNDFHITLPSEAVSIPAFFDGLLTNEILITPLKCGSFTIVLQIYPFIENVNLPINPFSVICHIKSDAVLIKRLLSSTNSSQINYNLFKDCDNHRTIDLIISNDYFSNEIPLKFSLEPSKCLMFEPLYRHRDSTIHSFRCPDAYSLYMVTKTQYEIKIPLKIESFGEQTVASSLTVAIDSVSNSHALAIYRLSVTFWPKKVLTEPSLQCSDSSILLIRGKWKITNFRNKSIDSAIHVKLECTRDKSLITDFVIFSSSEFIIPPKEKLSINLMIDENTSVNKNSKYNILAKHYSGLGKFKTVLIPIEIY